MKQLRSLWTFSLLVLCSLVMTACEGDQSFEGGSVLGHWVAYEASAKPSGMPWETAITVDANSDLAKGVFADITFQANGTCSGTWRSKDDQDAFSGSWSVSGTTLTVTVEGKTVTGPFDVSTDKLTFQSSYDYKGTTYDIRLRMNRG